MGLEFDAVYMSGALMKHLHDALPAAMRGACAEPVALLALLLAALAPGDVLLVKGSNGSKMHQVAAALTGQAKITEKKHAV